jgi:hypothetical protein
VVVIVTTFSVDSVADAFIICDEIYGRENSDYILPPPAFLAVP